MFSRSAFLRQSAVKCLSFLIYILVPVVFPGAACKLQAQSVLTPEQSGSLQSPLLPSQAPAMQPHGVMVRQLNPPNSSSAIRSSSIPSGCAPPIYYKGPVISNVQVVPVFWGSYLNPQITANIDQFYSDVVVSDWYDLLSEYASVGGTSQSIGRGTALPAITITPSRCASSSSCTLTDAQLQTELNNQIQSGVLPLPQQDSTGNAKTLYMVYFPPNVTLTSGTDVSCQTFCAYHSTATLGSSGTPLLYGAIMDTFTAACNQGCGSNATPLENETSVSSHELAEAVTDADVGLATTYAAPLAWYDQSCGEIGDLCNAQASTITVGGRNWVVQQMWSNGLNACVGVGLHPNYLVAASPTTPAGTPFNFTVTIKNPSGNKGTDIAYVGTAHFTSSDPGAVLPADFAYITGDQGTSIFTATLNSSGSQTITATDTLNGSIVGTSGPITVSAVVAGAPIIGLASAGDTQATVSFTAPSFNGGATITAYTAASSPGGLTGTCAASPCTVTGLTNGIAYTFTVTAINSAGTGPASAASNSVTPQASQTITFNNPGAQVFGTSPALAATASSSLPVAFSSATPAVCTVTSSGTLSFVRTGACTINANQAGNNAYAAAPQVSQSFTVNKGTATVTLSSLNQTYTGTPLAATAATNPAGLTVNLTYNGSTTVPIPANTYAVVATISDANYQGSATATLVIGKATPTVNWTGPGSIAFGTALSAAQLNAAASVPGSFTYTPASGTVLSSGTHTLMASFTPADTSDYNSPQPVTVSITVTQAMPTLSWTVPASISYGTLLSASQLNATASVPGTFNYSPPLGTLLSSGTHTLAAYFAPADTTDYSSPQPATVAITVTQAALNITANNASRTYGTANPSFSGAVTGAVNGDAFSEAFSTAATINSNAGTYSIVPSVIGANLADYAVSIQNGTLSIAQAGTTTSLSVSSASITPGQSATLTAQVVSTTSGTPTGSVSFYDGTTLLGTLNLTAGSAAFNAPSLAAGVTHTLTAVYGGDVNFLASSTSAATSVAVAPLDFTLTLAGAANQTVMPGGAVTYQVVVDPLYGSYAGPVRFAVSGLPIGATASFTPSTIAATGGQQTVALTIQTANVASLHGAPSIGGKLAPLSLALLLLPLAGRRRRRFARLLALLFLLGGVVATATLTGCGGRSLPPPQSYDVTITASAGNLLHSTTVTVEVQ